MNITRLATICTVIFIDLCIIPLTFSELYSYVTCGSVIKLLNNHLKVRLHSHEVKYGSGSGQQSVTAVEDHDDVNSHWVIKGKGGKMCKRGEPISCGAIIRLEHLPTKKNLHSHHFSSPLSNNQEVSAFGEDGEGDTGDHWTVTCSSDYWERSGLVRFKHADTDMWLGVPGNTYGRPISGQKEVAALHYSDSSCYWKTSEGVFIKPSDLPVPTIAHVHSEL
ncbi:stromal cell-derived factor 2 [Trichonephila inaurata madagascariensis]|uniref:Stromal cell-derived factor 2 n=1 Tax=Trichonephila inaurata madagascariensis TaxID=2747483 RepID=A0A8X6X0U0_9ARAC|nr:stromal cell-derived factor 2 [Trichonephila inaurata madagascariensis]